MSGNEKIGAIIGALITLILFVGVPYLLPTYIPADIAELLAQSGFEMQSFINQIMIIGVITAALTLVKGFVGKASIISLLVSVAQNLASLVFTVVLLGVGDIGSLGLTSFTVSLENITSYIVMDLRAFIYFTVLVVGLRVVEAYLKWSEARAELTRPGRIPP